jgi:GT2 family glycosyltransferase
MTASRVSAVVVTWNAGESLLSCCDSLRASASASGTVLQLVVVDNASSDGSVERLDLEDHDVCLRNPLNAGYSVAVSQGIARSEADWLLLVNPDVVVARDFFEKLLEAATAAPPSVATLVPELRFSFAPDVVNCRGLTVDEAGIPAEVDAGMPIATPPRPTAILGGSSGCCLLRAAAVRAVRGPEPAFFAYLEDADLALRLSRAGHEALFVPAAVAQHEGSASTGGRSALKTFLVARNRRLLFRLNGPYDPRARAWRSAVELGHAVVSTLRGTRAAPWTGRLDALRLRRYTRFVRDSRAAYDVDLRPPELTPRASLRSTLRRKRAIDGSLGH